MKVEYELMPDGRSIAYLQYDQRIHYEPRTNTYTWEQRFGDDGYYISTPISSDVLKRLLDMVTENGGLSPR